MKILCIACSRSIPENSQRTLGSSKDAVRFLGTFGKVPTSALGKSSIYICKPGLENGEKVLDELNRAISGCRRYFDFSEVEIRAVPKAQVEGETDTYEIPSQLGSKFVTKRFSVCYISMSFFG